ncbi:MAG: hypothetical protein Kow0090_06620 [Myxococcota bacterium]
MGKIKIFYIIPVVLWGILAFTGQRVFLKNHLETPLSAFHESDQWRLILSQANGAGDYAAAALRVSELFLGAPYKLSPLGEGAGKPPDEDPMFAVEAFDCLSLVEISLAAAYGGTKEGTLNVLRAIRYKGSKVDYDERNHFMMAQWIPSNIKKGFVKDITDFIGGDKVIVESKEYTEKSWAARKQGKGIELSEANRPKGIYSIKVVPVDKALDVIDNIPAGAIMSVVREDFYTMPFRISHLGFIVIRNGERYFRHASQTGWQKVVDVPLKEYIERISKYSKWRVTGLNFLYPKPPVERVTDK